MNDTQRTFCLKVREQLWTATVMKEQGGLQFAEENFGQGIYRPSCVESAWGKMKTAALSTVKNDQQDHNAERKKKNKTKTKETKV
jgi:hypothetical protein